MRKEKDENNIFYNEKRILTASLVFTLIFTVAMHLLNKNSNTSSESIKASQTEDYKKTLEKALYNKIFKAKDGLAAEIVRFGLIDSEEKITRYLNCDDIDALSCELGSLLNDNVKVLFDYSKHNWYDAKLVTKGHQFYVYPQPIINGVEVFENLPFEQLSENYLNRQCALYGVVDSNLANNGQRSFSYQDGSIVRILDNNVVVRCDKDGKETVYMPNRYSSVYVSDDGSIVWMSRLSSDTTTGGPYRVIFPDGSSIEKIFTCREYEDSNYCYSLVFSTGEVLYFNDQNEMIAYIDPNTGEKCRNIDDVNPMILEKVSCFMPNIDKGYQYTI